MAERQPLSHEEIVKSFLDSNAVDFNALGRFVAEFGEGIVLTGRGDYGVRFGRNSIIACFKNIAPQFIPEAGPGGLVGEIVGGP